MKLYVISDNYGYFCALFQQHDKAVEWAKKYLMDEYKVNEDTIKVVSHRANHTTVVDPTYAKTMLELSIDLVPVLDAEE